MFCFRTLFGKIFLVFLGVVLLASVFLSIFIAEDLRKSGIAEVSEGLFQEGERIQEIFFEEYGKNDTGAQLMDEIQKVADLRKTYVQIYDKYDVKQMEAQGDETLFSYTEFVNKNVEMLLCQAEEKTVSSVNIPGPLITPIVSVKVPIVKDGEKIGYILIHKRFSNYANEMKRYYHKLFMVDVFAILFMLGILGVFYKKTKNTIDKINYSARAFARGNFKERVAIEEKKDLICLSETFNAMADALEKYENTRQSFVGNISHELRSPLTTIQGFVQGVLDGTIEAQDQKQYLELVLMEAHRMNALITDLLDLAKIESGQFPMNISEWDINEALRRCLINCISKIEEKNIEVTVEIPDRKCIVLADEHRIMQVITNLLDNAVKFCEQNGTIKIWTYDTEGRVHVNISNTGEIIPEEDIPFVFDRFFKVDKAHNRKAGGTGIGLSIVKNIIMQHGEKIWVNSQKRTGTVFTFTLREKQETEQIEQPTIKASSRKRRTN